jgi:hypothetical protein
MNADEELWELGTGKSREPADWKVCATGLRLLFITAIGAEMFRGEKLTVMFSEELIE